MVPNSLNQLQHAENSDFLLFTCIKIIEKYGRGWCFPMELGLLNILKFHITTSLFKLFEISKREHKHILILPKKEPRKIKTKL